MKFIYRIFNNLLQFSQKPHSYSVTNINQLMLFREIFAVHSENLSIYLWLYSPCRPLDGGSARRKAATYAQEKRTQTSMPRAGFEPTIPVLQRPKAVHALYLAATVIGYSENALRIIHNFLDEHSVEVNFFLN
jgi:hypothetical protein